ncbi:MAG: FkbM family methyltransferase [Bacteroidetes bacterium]|jgi:FkbM family methyltransferase|nr:FkbM family methyltransferase [Bacteroidota bacterium]
MINKNISLKTKLLNLIREVFKIPFFENTLRKILNKNIGYSFFVKLVPNNYQYKKNSIKHFSYKGINLKLDIHDYVGHYHYFGLKDIEQTNLMRLIKPGDFVIDIGTNYGTTLLQFANLIGVNGKTFGFEPDPINFEICNQNIQLNHFTNLSVENIGLGNKEAEVNLVVDVDSNRGGNRISENIIGKESYQIKIVKFDNWVLDKMLNKINLIKIDVEGYEMEVLKGAENSIKKYKPILFIELDDNNLKQQNSSAKEVISYLISLNYSIINSLTNKQVNLSDNFLNCHFDIICR